MKIYCSSLTLPAASLKKENALPRFRDREQNKHLVDLGLLDSEREGFGYQTQGFVNCLILSRAVIKEN
jgi:hypothetical protein